MYPKAARRHALARAFGCAHVVWNDCLRARECPGTSPRRTRGSRSA
ncbi:helix-turn-helix domain-containing protein [Streptomyces sp. NPDC005271]